MVIRWFARHLRQSFNGAAPARARNLKHGRIPQEGPLALQRGRARAGAEFGPGHDPWATQNWLQRGRARAGAELPYSMIPTPTESGFNGAAPARARNYISRSRSKAIPARLQRGRARAGAELFHPLNSCQDSIELQRGRARAGAELAWRRGLRVQSFLLQRGRARAGAEFIPVGVFWWLRQQLQRGRARAGAELSAKPSHPLG